MLSKKYAIISCCLALLITSSNAMNYTKTVPTQEELKTLKISLNLINGQYAVSYFKKQPYEFKWLGNIFTDVRYVENPIYVPANHPIIQQTYKKALLLGLNQKHTQWLTTENGLFFMGCLEQLDQQKMHASVCPMQTTATKTPPAMSRRNSVVYHGSNPDLQQQYQ